MSAWSDLVGPTKASWDRAPEEDRRKLVYYISGQILMSTAIIVTFGWMGVMFCVGHVFHVASDPNVTKD